MNVMSNMEMLVCASLSFSALCWGIGGLSFAWARWKESKYWGEQDDDDEGGGDQPKTHYDIDPQRDPSDWWKHDKTNT